MDPRFDTTVQNQPLQKACWRVNANNENKSTGNVRFCTVLPVPRPVLSQMCNVDDNEWRRVMTIVMAYATGNNGVSDRWISVRQLVDVYSHIFETNFPFAKWDATSPKGLTSALSQRLSVWTDAAEFDYVKLPVDGHKRRTTTYPLTEWPIRYQPARDDVLTEWGSDWENLRDSVDVFLNDQAYLEKKMQLFFLSYGNADFEWDWFKWARIDAYCILLVYFPLGCDPNAIMETYQKLYKKNFSDGSKRGFSLNKLLGHYIDDVIVNVRESDMHQMVYPIFFHGLEIPEGIMKSRWMKKTVTTVTGESNSQYTVITCNGKKVVQKRKLRDFLPQ